MSKRKQIKELEECLNLIINFPKTRRDAEGYPLEIVYDEFAYKRIVDAYREAAKEGLTRAARFKA